MAKITKDRFTYRLLEIMPGFIAWNVILFPYWGIFVIPEVVAYFVLFFNIYWFYQSLQIAITATMSHLRIQAAMKLDWVNELKSFPDWQKVRNVIIIPTYKEPQHILERTIDSLANQKLPREMITVVVAQENRAPNEDKITKMDNLRKKYKGVFGNFIVTMHTLADGEIIGKSSNERYSAIEVKKQLVDKEGYDINYMTVTSCDADHVYHPNHFAVLTFKFLDNPKRYTSFWQPAVMFYTNIWELPAITRVPNTLSSIWNLSQLPRRDRLINGQNYSLSYKLLDEVDYWDPDKIPEDWGIFFKAFFGKKGGIEVEPIYLPLYADAPQASSMWKTIKAHYTQQMRWAWGVSDVPWIWQKYATISGIPFIDKTMRVLFVSMAHLLWPINWFVITIGLTLPSIINPAFGRTTLGYTVPKLSSFILTLALAFLIVMLVLDRFYKPKRPKNFPLWRAILMPAEFLLMPVAGLIFGAIPGLDAHTRLMMGKYIEYKVTEKV